MYAVIYLNKEIILVEEKSLCLSILLINHSFIAIFEFYSDTEVRYKQTKKKYLFARKKINMCQLQCQLY